MTGGPNFAGFYPNSSGGALPDLSEGPLIWAPALTGRFCRKSTKIGGTGGWRRGAYLRFIRLLTQ